MIRRLQPAELSQLTWIDQWQSPQFQWKLEQVIELASHHEFWGFCEGDRILAFVGGLMIPGAFEIALLATHPAHVRRGLMQKLLDEVINVAHQDTEVWLEVHESNQAAQQLYKGLGFVEVGRRERYYSDAGAALLLSRKIAR